MLNFSPIRRSEYNATLFLSPIVTKIKFPSINSSVGLINLFRLIKDYKNQWKSFLLSFHRLSSFQCAFCWYFAGRNVVFVFKITYSPISHTCLPRWRRTWPRLFNFQGPYLQLCWTQVSSLFVNLAGAHRETCKKADKYNQLCLLLYSFRHWCSIQPNKTRNEIKSLNENKKSRRK